MVSTPTHAEELFQMRLLLEQQLLSADLDDEQAVAGLLQQVDWLQACCGQRQLTAEVSSTMCVAFHRRLNSIDYFNTLLGYQLGTPWQGVAHVARPQQDL
jgi:hypothetical protein